MFGISALIVYASINTGMRSVTRPVIQGFVRLARFCASIPGHTVGWRAPAPVAVSVITTRSASITLCGCRIG